MRVVVGVGVVLAIVAARVLVVWELALADMTGVVVMVLDFFLLIRQVFRN